MATKKKKNAAAQTNVKNEADTNDTEARATPTWCYVALIAFVLPNANALGTHWLLWTILSHAGFAVGTFFCVGIILLIVHEKELKEDESISDDKVIGPSFTWAVTGLIVSVADLLVCNVLSVLKFIVLAVFGATGGEPGEGWGEFFVRAGFGWKGFIVWYGGWPFYLLSWVLWSVLSHVIVGFGVFYLLTGFCERSTGTSATDESLGGWWDFSFLFLFPWENDGAMKREEALEVLNLPKELAQVDDEDTQKKVKKAYRTLALKWHPDKRRGGVDPALAKATFQKISRAYDALTNPEASLKEGWKKMARLYRLLKRALKIVFITSLVDACIMLSASYRDMTYPSLIWNKSADYWPFTYPMNFVFAHLVAFLILLLFIWSVHSTWVSIKHHATPEPSPDQVYTISWEKVKGMFVHVERSASPPSGIRIRKTLVQLAFLATVLWTLYDFSQFVVQSGKAGADIIMATEVTSVADFMAQQKLGQYTESLLAEGYDDLEVLRELSASQLDDLADVVGMKPGHAAKLVLRLQVPETPPEEAWQWGRLWGQWWWPTFHLTLLWMVGNVLILAVILFSVHYVVSGVVGVDAKARGSVSRWLLPVVASVAGEETTVQYTSLQIILGVALSVFSLVDLILESNMIFSTESAGIGVPRATVPAYSRACVWVGSNLFFLAVRMVMAAIAHMTTYLLVRLFASLRLVPDYLKPKKHTHKNHRREAAELSLQCLKVDLVAVVTTAVMSLTEAFGLTDSWLWRPFSFGFLFLQAFTFFCQESIIVASCRVSTDSAPFVAVVYACVCFYMFQTREYGALCKGLEMLLVPLSLWEVSKRVPAFHNFARSLKEKSMLSSESEPVQS